MNDLKIGIIGVGGVGGFLAGLLCRTYPHVTLGARSQRKEDLISQGVILHSDLYGEVISEPERICEVKQMQAQDILFICVKNYSLDTVCQELSSLISNRTIIVPVMNGVDSGDRIRQTVPRGIVIDAVIYIVSFLNKNGSISQEGDFARLFIGTKNKKHLEASLLIHRVLSNAGIDSHFSEDIEAEIWRKYILNCAYNVLTARYEEPIGALRKSPIKSKQYEDLLWEAYAVAKAKGVRVTAKDVENMIHKFYHEYANNATSSLMRDIMNHKPAELETFGGYIVKEGERLHVPVTVSKQMYEAIMMKVSSQT